MRVWAAGHGRRTATLGDYERPMIGAVNDHFRVSGCPGDRVKAPCLLITSITSPSLYKHRVLLHFNHHIAI
jgi:hypothetical protein